MNSAQLKPVAFLFLVAALYLLALQYQTQLNFYVIPSLPFDVFFQKLLLRYPCLSRCSYLTTLGLMLLFRQGSAERPFMPVEKVGFMLLPPIMILFWASPGLRAEPFAVCYPATILLISLISSRLRFPPLSPVAEQFGIKNPISKVQNEYSFNWRTDTGYINLLNPFQGVLIVGGAGSGKTYSLIEEIISQAITKKYTGFIYDYKYPELSNFVFDSLNEARPENLNYYHINFTDMERTHRINPLHPYNLPVSAFAAEYAGVILRNLKKEWVSHADFWADNAIAYLKAIIWYMKRNHPEYCSLPHIICMSMIDYPVILGLLSRDPECRGMVASLLTAYKENAGQQVAGCISSLQTPLDKLNNPLIFWVLSGNDCDLNLNDPAHPALLTIGNNPQLAETIGPVISLVASVVMKKINQKNRLKSIFILDEAPTLYIPDLKNLPNTGRSNQICTVYCCQDFSQMNVLYGADESRAIRASLASQFIGMVNDVETAEMVSRMFGQMEKQVTNLSSSSGSNSSDDENYSRSLNTEHREKNLINANEIMTLGTGVFIGKTTEAKRPFFRGRPLIGPKPEHQPVPAFKDLLFKGLETGKMPDQETLTRKLLDLNFRKIKYECEEIISRISPGS